MVVVFRIVGRDPHPRVLQHRARMDQSFVDRERVDERLERRPRRATPQQSVHLAIDLTVKVVGRADVTFYLHVSIVEQDYSAVVDAEVLAALEEGPQLKLEQTLDAKVERRIYTPRVADGEHPINQVRRAIGKLPSIRHPNDRGRAEVLRMSPDPKRSNPEPGLVERIMPRAAQRISHTGTLRNDGESQSLRHRQLLR